MLRTLLVFAILVPGIAMGVRDRFKALLLYLWWAFFRPQDWVWIDITFLQPSLALGMLLIVPSIFSGFYPNLTHPLSIGSCLFLLSALIAQFNAVNAAMGWDWIDFFTRLIIVCLLAVTLTTTPRRFVWVLAVVSGSFGFHAAKAGLASLLGGGLRFFDGLSGAFVDNNGYACGTAMMIPLLVAVGDNIALIVPPEYPRALKWIRRGFRVSVPLCMFTVISTYSRGGFLALAAAMMVYVALHRSRVRFALSLAAVMIILLTFVPIPEDYVDRLETIQTYDEIGEESAISRTHFWQVALAMADDKPFGVGLRNYEFAYDKYDFSYGRYGHGRAVHSSHFQVLAEQGYFGVLIWFTQFGIAFFVALQVRRRSWTPGLPPESARFLMSTSNCIISSMTAFFVGGSFLGLALNDVTWLTFSLLAALDIMSARMCDEVKPSFARVVAPMAAAIPLAHRPAPAPALWREPV
ncbi:MAG TPA: O-antigen ligase family protein [Vicinamibacterales bacterium]|jgi:probable O-glycosylation ligase (exosortase A-associated)|nr:O-antigen ligase family protein [Vicinamibacterales bacterium]